MADPLLISPHPRNDVAEIPRPPSGALTRPLDSASAHARALEVPLGSVMLGEYT